MATLFMALSLVAVAEVEMPDLEFLEYLGSWEESDEDWVMFRESADGSNETDERSDPAPEGEASTETDDEN